MRAMLKSALPQVGTVLLIWFVLIGCRLFSAPANPESGRPTVTAIHTPAPSESSGPTQGGFANGAGTLQVSDVYPFPFSNSRIILASSLEAVPGKVWIGTLNGTIEEVDAQSGAFGRSLALVPGAGDNPMDVKPVLQLRFESGHLWASAHFIEADSQMNRPHLLAIDADKMRVARQWDQSLESAEWAGENYQWIADPAIRVDPQYFCTSPGKIWMEGHVIDARTFEVVPDAYDPGVSYCAYNGKGWMWTTRWTGGEDGLYFVHADDFTGKAGQYRWPFLVHDEGLMTAQGESFMALAGDRMWMGRSQAEPGSVGMLDVFPADVDELMRLDAPLASVPLLESLDGVRLLHAGNYLWVLYVAGAHGGWLHQLDPLTGATVASLDLIQDEGRAMGNIPMDIASEGEHLWVATSQQLLRIKIP